MATKRDFAQEELPLTPVENPILCSPYAEPSTHWYYNKDNHQMEKLPGRRRASFFDEQEGADKTRDQGELFEQEGAALLKIADSIREDVRKWRVSKWEGATNTTKLLLQHWTNPDRERRLFFCQIEAVETLIFLNEIRGMERSGTRHKPRFNPKFEDKDFTHLLDIPNEANLKPLPRYCTKMCTGSGKTVVMAMLIAWAMCNRGKVPSDERFPKGALIVCPNLTVKERLQVLRPGEAGNYYDEFDIVPMNLRPLLVNGRVLVMNWHGFAPESSHSEGGKNYGVVNKGEESHETFAKRVLGDLANLGGLMVLNDEAHHAYRPAPITSDKLTPEEKAEREEATLWIAGIDRLNAAGCVRFCADLSATPFYIGGSGYAPGKPFGWIVSDFGLLDGIESGIVKIPRLPVADNTGHPEPKYFRLWRHVTEKLPASDFLNASRRNPKPEAVWREAEAALQTMAGQYIERFQLIEAASDRQDKIPPVMIIVCDNTNIAEHFYRQISGETEQEVEEDSDSTSEEEEEEDPTPKKTKAKKRTVYGESKLRDEFKNTSTRKHTVRIDSKLLEKVESEDPTVRKDAAAQALRRVISTVGKRGEPGEQVRCVVSVSMLTEGWDANNVTHIFGLRPFESQLLCEQVVGRALRRMDYTVDRATGLLTEEYADIYGIPFSVIPFKGRATNKPAPEDKPKNHVRALEEKKGFEIRFPIVEGYAFASQPTSVTADVMKIEPLQLEPQTDPILVIVKPRIATQEGVPTLVGPGEIVKQDRSDFYNDYHPQTIAFDIALRVVEHLTAAAGKLRTYSRHLLFPQVLRITQEYMERRVILSGCDIRELALEKYSQRLVERLSTAIQPTSEEGEPPLVPILNRYKSFGTSSEVNFLTTRPCMDTIKSHVNQVVLDTNTWESAAVTCLEASPLVRCYVRNDHMGFSIPYEYSGTTHGYFPDFLVRLQDTRTIILEIKGQQIDSVAAKAEAAKQWCRAVNQSDKLGRWQYHQCNNPQTLQTELEQIVAATEEIASRTRART